jgi:hypothetical protein
VVSLLFVVGVEALLLVTLTAPVAVTKTHPMYASNKIVQRVDFDNCKFKFLKRLWRYFRKKKY